MPRKALLLPLLAFVAACGGGTPDAGKPAPYRAEFLALDFSQEAFVEVGDSIALLRRGTQEIRLPRKTFGLIALDYARFQEARGKSFFTIGVEGENFEFSFEHRTTLILLVLLGLLLLLTALVTTLRFRRRLRKLSAEQARLFEQRRLVEQGQEQERHRLARDLHDGPLQSLYALRMQLARRTPDLGAQDLAIAQIADHLRGVTTALRSPLLAPFGLSSALQNLAPTYPGLEIEPLIDPEAEHLLDEHARNTLFRVAQEATSNAVRHGRATRVTTRLVHDRQHVRMTIRDNGAGFDTSIPVESYGAAGHYGLVGMRERVEVLGGSIRLQSSPAGTEVDLFIPAAPPAAQPPATQGDGASSTRGLPVFP